MKEKNIHLIFLVGLGLKGLNAILEVLGGILFLSSGTFNKILTFLTNKELIEDPTDFLATRVAALIPYLSTHSQLFFSFYLLSHGIIKIVLVISVLRNKIWAYPATILFLCTFIVYQLYRFTYTHSIFLIFLTVFDIFLIYLTSHEYRLVRKHQSLS